MATVPAGEQQPGGITPVVAAPSSGRRRRPSGEPPPLPRRIEWRTRASVVLVGAVLGLAAAMSTGPVLRLVTALDGMTVMPSPEATI